MSTDTKLDLTPEPDDTASPDLIRADIMVTRARLGDTVEALAAKADVKAQLAERKERAKEAARSGMGTARRQWRPLALAAGSAVLVGIGLAIGRKRMRR